MPKTILLPKALRADKYDERKVVVIRETEIRNVSGRLLRGTYQFIFNCKRYSYTLVYNSRYDVIYRRLVCLGSIVPGIHIPSFKVPSLS